LKGISKIYVKFSLLTALLYILIFFFSQSPSLSHLTSLPVWFIPGFYGLVFFAHSAILLKASKGSPQEFVRAFMGLTSIKLFVLLGILVVLLFGGIPRPKLFALWYLGCYFLYSSLAVLSLYRHLKNKA
jgi:hypothetical protein